MKAPAVFLDRDGTLIEDVGYVRHPDAVRLLPGAAAALQRFRELGFRLFLVSNQSGVARGLFSEDDLKEVHTRVEQMLAENGVRLDGAYYCPYYPGPEAVVEAYRRDSELRKPRPGMLVKAAKEHDIDLARSWMIGDQPSDTEAGRRAGCRTILLCANGPNGRSAALAPPVGVDPSTPMVHDLAEAAVRVEQSVTNQPNAPGSTSAPVVAKPTIIPERRMSSARDAALPNASPPPDSAVGEPPASLEVLVQIRDRLDEANRQRQQQDFSVLRLLGALLQMLALVAAAWGLLAIIESDASASARLALACFCQLAALTAFALDRFR